MKQPLVSLIIPVYNGDRFIAEALDSALNQTYPKLEIIVVNDGSTDTTEQILSPYVQHHSDKLKYHYQENQGSAVARNQGLHLAKGALIAFLDADDVFIRSDKIEHQVSFLNQHPDIGCCQTGWRLIAENGEVIRKIQPWKQHPILSLETWLQWKPIRTSALMVRRSDLDAIDGFDGSLRQVHDLDLVVRLTLQGCRSAWVPEISVNYKQHSSNTTRDGEQQAQAMLRVLNNVFNHADIPQSVKTKEKQIRYDTLVWIAYHQLYTGNLNNIVPYLQASLKYSPYLKAETISNWIRSFRNFADAQAFPFDVNVLLECPDWQQLTNTVIGRLTLGG